MHPNYDFDKIKFATDAPTFEKALAIYESNAVSKFEDNGISGFSANVRGSGGKFYDVFVSARHYDEGECNCYVGQSDALCKHIVSLAIYAVKRGEPLTVEDRRQVSSVTCSETLGQLNKDESTVVKKNITDAMRYIKPYNGPSRVWFSYQNSLVEGCNRLAKIISDLPVSEQTTDLIVQLLLRLDKKLCSGGVDDSDGTVGGFIEETVCVLIDYAKLDTKCLKVFVELKGKKTCFGWEKPLLKLID